MKHIFILEMKKALHNKKNWFIMALYMSLLVIFAVSNMRVFEEVLRKESVGIEQLVNSTRNVALMHNEQLVSEDQSWIDFWVEEPIVHLAILNDLDSTTKFAQNYSMLNAAMLQNDRKREFEIFNKAAGELYFGISKAREYYGDLPKEHRNIISYKDWEEFCRARADFIQQFEDNGIAYAYKSEMTGFNFLYQAMLQFVPILILLIAFISACDRFTSDNEAGSYKFLLLQPYSRLKIYAVKLIAALFTSLVQIFAPLIVVFMIMGAVNGFGSPNYPVLFQTKTYTSLTPTPNQLATNTKQGFSFIKAEYFDSVNDFTYNGYAYIVENASMGISKYSPWKPYTSAFVPHPSLGYAEMLSCILMTIPIYIALLLFVAALSSLIGIISQNSAITLVCGAIIGAAAAFPAPIKDLTFIQRLNPLIYTNPVNILNGLGSTTALTGILVLTILSAILAVFGAAIFSKRDIKC